MSVCVHAAISTEHGNRIEHESDLCQEPQRSSYINSALAPTYYGLGHFRERHKNDIPESAILLVYLTNWPHS